MAPRLLPSRTWNHFAAQLRILGKDVKEKKKTSHDREAETDKEAALLAAYEVPMEVDHANNENLEKEMQKEAGIGDNRGLAEMEARMQSIILSQVEAMNRKWEKATGDALDVVINMGRRNVEEKMEEVKIGNTMVEERLEIGLVNLEAKMEMGLGDVDNKIERVDVAFTKLKDFTYKIPGKVNKGFNVFDLNYMSLRKDLSDLGMRCDSCDQGTSKQSEKLEILQTMLISSVQNGKKDLEEVDTKIEKLHELFFGSSSIYNALEGMKQEILESVDEDMNKMMCFLSAAAKDEESGVRRPGSEQQEHRKKSKRKS